MRYLFKELSIEEPDYKEYSCNDSLKEITLQLKIFGLPNIFNICLFNNIAGLTCISIGDLDIESFDGFLNDYKKHLDKMNNLTTLKIGLNNTIISYDTIDDKIKEFINTNSVNLKEKVLFSYLEFENMENLNNLKNCVKLAKIEKLVVQIGQNNQALLNSCEFNENEKNRIELESLYYIMTKSPYNLLIKDKIIRGLRKYFKKSKEKLVVCKPYFSIFDIYEHN